MSIFVFINETTNSDFDSTGAFYTPKCATNAQFHKRIPLFKEEIHTICIDTQTVRVHYIIIKYFSPDY